jgi:hypothetical protein
MTQRSIFDVYRCIMVAAKTTPAMRAVVPANIQLLGNFLSTTGVRSPITVGKFWLYVEARSHIFLV